MHDSKESWEKTSKTKYFSFKETDHICSWQYTTHSPTGKWSNLKSNVHSKVLLICNQYNGWRDLMVGLSYSIYLMATCLMIQGWKRPAPSVHWRPPSHPHRRPTRSRPSPWAGNRTGPQIQALFWTLGPSAGTPSSRPSPSSCLNPEPVAHVVLIAWPQLPQTSLPMGCAVPMSTSFFEGKLWVPILPRRLYLVINQFTE